MKQSHCNPQDGHIDFREFMIVLYIMSNGSPGDKDETEYKNLKRQFIQKNPSLINETFSEENLKQIFRVFDINNDGTITLKVSLRLRYFAITLKVSQKLNAFAQYVTLFFSPGASKDSQGSVFVDQRDKRGQGESRGSREDR